MAAEVIKLVSLSAKLSELNCIAEPAKSETAKSGSLAEAKVPAFIFEALL